MSTAKTFPLAVLAAALGLWAPAAHAAKAIELSAPAIFMQRQCPRGWEWDEDEKKCVRQTRGSF